MTTDTAPGLRAALVLLDEARREIHSMQTWVAALAYGKSHADHKIVVESPRFAAATKTMQAIDAALSAEPTLAELQADLARAQSALARRVLGDQTKGVSLAAGRDTGGGT